MQLQVRPLCASAGSEMTCSAPSDDNENLWSIAGDSLAEVSAAIGRLASCDLRYAAQLPHQAALQSQGWLAQRCVCYHDAGSDTLCVGIAAGAGGTNGSREEARVSLQTSLAHAGSTIGSLHPGVPQEKLCRLTRPASLIKCMRPPRPRCPAVQEQEAAATRALLLAFLSSHAVLWLQHAQQPAPLLPRAADLLQRLRLLQQLKSALLPGLLPLLGVPPAEATAAVPGLCIPQLLLLVQQRQPPVIEGVGSNGAPAAEAEQQAAAAVAEQQLRLLMKRCRVLLPEDTARALCTLPANGPALLLLPERLGNGSQEQLVAESLAELSLAGQAAGGSAAPAVQTSQQQQQQQQGKVDPAAAVAAALASQRAAVAGMAAGSGSAADLASWRQAVATLAAVLEAAALKATSASVIASSSSSSSGSNAEKAPPLPGGGPKAAAAGAGTDIAVPPEAAAAAAWQEACGDGVRQFSLASCRRAAAVAADAYRRNTPPLLPAAGHAVALQVGWCAAVLPTGHQKQCLELCRCLCD